MTDKEKRELLDLIEASCWNTLRQKPAPIVDVKDLLTSIEIIKEMRYDYQPDDDEEDEE